MRALTDKQKRFVDEYIVDLNATQAAIRAGYSKKNPDRIGAQLLGKTWVAQAVREAQAERGKRLEITADQVLKKWWQLVNADPRELVQYLRGPCDSCWDDDDPHEEPNKQCTRCRGYGRGKLIVSDTRNLSDDALALFAGIKIGKDGLEVKMHDKAAALVNVARHLGMFIDRIDAKVDHGDVVTHEELLHALFGRDIPAAATGDTAKTTGRTH